MTKSEEWQMHSFSKTIGIFDAITVDKSQGSTWTHITLTVGYLTAAHDVETIRMTLRSEEAVRDLLYALKRLLQIDA